MWNLYGKKYDLTAFARMHPGGAEIIEKTKGLEDCTALFESYHAFSDNAMSKITNSWFLWNHSLWFYHHVYFHHSFTSGDNDPDKYIYNVYMFKNNPYFEYIVNFCIHVFLGNPMSIQYGIYSMV